MFFLLLTHMWKLNNTLPYNQRAKKEILREIRNYLKRNENENTTYQNLWNAAKAVLGGKFMAVSANIKKEKFSNKLTLHLKELGKKTKDFMVYGYLFPNTHISGFACSILIF